MLTSKIKGWDFLWGKTWNEGGLTFSFDLHTNSSDQVLLIQEVLDSENRPTSESGRIILSKTLLTTIVQKLEKEND
jgi:hypothetical protein